VHCRLAQEIARALRVRITEAEVTKFSDGETRVSIAENVRGKDVFLIQSTSPPVNDNVMELLVILDALKRASAKRVTAVIPYYGYGRQGMRFLALFPLS
jgi:ribose-phosphate pyrophosphokinase